MADRDLIDRLLFLAQTAVDQALDLNYDDPEDYFIYRELRELKAAALAQPDPEGPTDEEIEEWADAATEVPLEEMDPDIHGWQRCFTAKEFSETIRAALARWGTPANTINQED